MSDDYDLKPVEPAPQPPAEPATPCIRRTSGSTLPPAPAVPPGFIPPVPVIEGPDEDPEEKAAAAAKEDIDKHKGVAILGYIPPLFIVPLTVGPLSKYAHFHANQGLLVAILSAAVVLMIMVLQACNIILFPILGSILIPTFILTLASCGVHLVQLAMIIGVMALSVMGIIHAANGESKPLPLVGRYTLIR